MKTRTKLLVTLPGALLISLGAIAPAMAATTSGNERPMQTQVQTQAQAEARAEAQAYAHQTGVGVVPFLYMVGNDVYISANGSQTGWEPGTGVTVRLSNEWKGLAATGGSVRGDGTFYANSFKIGTLDTAADADAVWLHTFTITLQSQDQQILTGSVWNGQPLPMDKPQPYTYSNAGGQLMLGIAGSKAPQTAVNGLSISAVFTDENTGEKTTIQGIVRSNFTVALDHDLPVTSGHTYSVYLEVAVGFVSMPAQITA